MITYPTIFFGNLGGGKIMEDFDDYADGSLPVRSQIWQYHEHQWLNTPNPNKFNGFTWKDYGISGAIDLFDNYNVGPLVLDFGSLHGLGNFDINSWTGFSVGFYRDRNGQYTSADQLRGYGFVWFDWGSNAPLPGYKSDYWGAKFIGNFIIKTSGDYTFYVERDEWARIYVGREDGPNNLIFDKWGVSPPPFGDEATSAINFSPGITTMLIHFYEDIGNAKLKLSWSGPDFGKRPMLPSDFGNSGYIREYVTTYGGRDTVWGNINSEGAYRLGIPFVPQINEKVRHEIYPSGNYSLGVITMGTYQDKGYELVEPKGLYTVAYNYSRGVDRSRTNVSPQGLYYYKYQPVQYNEKISNDLNAAGHYSFKNVFQYQNEKVRERLDLAGFHITGRVNTDRFNERVNNILDGQGFYAYQIVHTRAADYANLRLAPIGNYFPIHVYAPYREQAATYLNTAGYHFTGYINTLSQDKSRNLVHTNGHYAYAIVSGDFFNDKGETILRPEGFYAYGNYTSYTNEQINEVVDLGGLYLPRYEYLPYGDAAAEHVNADGAYYSRFLPQRFGDKAYNKFDPQGYYASGQFHLPTRDKSYERIDPVGHYATGQIPLTYFDKASNLVNSQGNYFYAILSYVYNDKVKNVVNYDGYYRSIYAYFKYSDKAQEIVRIDGNYYYRYSQTLQKDKGFTTLDPHGFYDQATVRPYGNDAVMGDINTAGNYFFRFISGATNEKVHQHIGIDANYFSRFFPANFRDAACSLHGVDGTYLPRYPIAEASNKDLACLVFDTAGSYDERYPKFKGRDEAFDIVDMFGDYYSTRLGILLGDKACNILDPSGEYFYGRVPVQTQDQGFNYLGMDEGRYFSRYVPFYGVSKSLNVLSCAGDYIRESYIIVDSGVLSVDFDSEFVSFYEHQDLGKLSAEFSGNYTVVSSASTLEYWLEIYKRDSYNMSKSQQYFNI